MIVLRWAMWLFAKFVLPLRYRVRVQDWEKLRDLTGPVLLLPSHPAYVDPMLFLLTFWPRFRMRPLLAEGMFQNPLFYPIMKLVEAIRVPEIDQPSAEARARAEAAIQEVIDSLRSGRSCVLWPAGRVERRGREVLGAARAASDILKAVPETTVILVCTRGLWGSRFSYARTGSAPSFGKNLLAGVGWMLASLIFFLPRRRVTMTVEVLDRNQLPGLDRQQLNPWLEGWYNADLPEGKGEQPTFVPYHLIFGTRTYDYPEPATLVEADLSKVKPETKSAVAHLVAEKLGRELEDREQRPDITLAELGVDSLGAMDLALTVERQFGFSGDDVPATLGHLWALAQGLVERKAAKPPPPEWFNPHSGAEQAEILGETIPEAFVARALTNRKDVVVADDLSGALTYERALIGSLVMAKRFREVPGSNVGLLLPSSAACDLALMGLYLAGKLPVVLNWTTGPANLEHAARLMGLTHVVTSKAFLDRAHVEVQGVEYLFLEDLRKTTGKLGLLWKLLKVRWLPGWIRAGVPRIDPDQPAVVLFTSGSEKAPKAVPLTHRNLLSNQRSGIPVLSLTRKDSVLAFLPAFHSFGMSVTGLLPLLTGVRVVRHPDPTDAAGIVRKAAGYRPTILVATPTFLSYILDRAKLGDLSSLRLIIVGAEKCPAALYLRCRELAPQAALVKGYGITECSPVVAVNHEKNNRPGTVGQALPGVELSVVDVETNEVLTPGQQGMLLVSGPTVFPGYIGQDAPSPFVERDGKRWYVTGDLVEMDAEGFVRFAGRLKRFLKAGGEMISLPALEEPFAKLYPPTEQGPRVAVEGIETHDGRRIVLFTTEPLTVAEANAQLRREGFHGVMRLDEVRRVESIPVLGTGKTDYKALRARLVEEQAGESSTPAAVSRGG